MKSTGAAGMQPLVLETTEALNRAGKSEKTIQALRAGRISLAEAQGAAGAKTPGAFLLKQLMAFYRRFMLLNMGDPALTAAAIAFASLEEAASRSFLVEIDAALRSLAGKGPLEGANLAVQRVVWAADAAMSVVAEFVAILVSTIAFVVLEPHGRHVMLGYVADERPDLATVMLLLFFEIAMEVATDAVAMCVLPAFH